MKIDGECLIELIGSCRNKVQVYRSVRMPQLHTSLHFHLTPIVMINGSSRRDLLLNSQNFCRSIPAGAENPSLSRLANLRPARGNLCTPPLPFGRPTPHRNCLPETVPWPSGISLMARAPPEGGLLRPPPKLRRKGPKPIPGNSEAS
ncbi:hypothetical protein RJ641_011895 [Dillenia turbinata]|uniref:Uncharacterized protein n=1 Tax=Dillenia turbinata TaxID=194707 RepID=A0AAN8UX43_9MAGN